MIKLNVRYLTPLWLTVCSLVMTTGCLTTRAQLKDDNASATSDSSSSANRASASNSQSTNPNPAMPGKVQDVQLQGSYAVDEIKAEMTRLEGRIEDLEHAAKDQAQATPPVTKDQFQKLDDRITELEHAQAQMIQALQKTQEAQAAAAAANPEEEMESGRAAVETGSFEVAIDHFSNAIKSNNPKIMEDALFLRGESYFALKQYKKAIIDFSKFPEKYTKSKNMPRALYRIGQSFEALGMNDDAKGFYQELLDKYPKSKEAKLVHQKIR